MADMINKNATPEAEGIAPAPKKKEKKEKKPKLQYLEKNQMNFLEKYEIVVEGKKNNVDITKIIKPLVILLIVVAIIFALTTGVKIFMNQKVKSLDKYINDPANVSSYNEAVALKQESENVKTQKTNLEALIKAIDSYPDVSREFFNAINKAATDNSVTIGQYGYAGETGVLSVSCSSASTAGISNFVRAMEATGLFADVEYNSFNGEAEGGYSFSVTCVCNGTEAK